MWRRATEDRWKRAFAGAIKGGEERATVARVSPGPVSGLGPCLRLGSPVCRTTIRVSGHCHRSQPGPRACPDPGSPAEPESALAFCATVCPGLSRVAEITGSPGRGRGLGPSHRAYTRRCRMRAVRRSLTHEGGPHACSALRCLGLGPAGPAAGLSPTARRRRAGGRDRGGRDQPARRHAQSTSRTVENAPRAWTR